MKLDLGDLNIFEATCTAEQARDFFDGGDELEQFVSALDDAQGYVFSGAGKVAFVVLKVTN